MGSRQIADNLEFRAMLFEVDLEFMRATVFSAATGKDGRESRRLGSGSTGFRGGS